MTRWPAWSGPRPRSPQSPRVLTAQAATARQGSLAAPVIAFKNTGSDEITLCLARFGPESCTRPFGGFPPRAHHAGKRQFILGEGKRRAFVMFAALPDALPDK